MLLSEIIEKVRWLAEEYPKDRAPSQYFDGSTPKCIIGCAALDLDLDLRQPKKGNALKITNPIVLDWLGVPEWDWKTNLDSLLWLKMVQEFQDRHLMWSECVHQADEKIKELIAA